MNVSSVILVIVPDKVAFELYQFELVVVHLGDHPRLPLVVDQPKFLREVDRPAVHQKSISRQ